MSTGSPSETSFSTAERLPRHRKQARAKQLRELVDRNTDVFRLLVDSVKDYAIFLLTPQGHIATWNAGAQNIKGYAAEEIIGRHFSVFYTPDALERDWPSEELRRATAEGRFEDEGWRVRKDGSRFWANVVITPVVGGDGQLLGFAKVTRDVTERREHEQRREAGERSLRLLIEGVQDYAIFSLDTRGVITSWNKGAQRIKGYEAREAIGKHFSMFYPQEAVQRGWPEEELRRAAAEGRFEDEGWRLRKDGARIWANVVITAIRDETGGLLGFSKVTRDLTERRRHEQALRQREENLRLLVEGVRDHAMFLLDAPGRIQTWNAGAQRVLGFRASDVLEKDVSVLYLAEDLASGKPTSEMASARAARSFQIEGWRQRCDGTRFWAHVQTTALFDDGGPRGFVQIIRDLTQQQRVQQLEDEGRRIGEFIAMLSHELRNPLAPMRNAVAILGRFAEKPETVWCVELLGRQLTHMTRLVDDLLDLSRVTSGKIRLDKVALDFNTHVRMAVESARLVVEARGHELHLRLAEAPVTVMADGTRLMQVVVNLLNNASKFTPQGGRIDVMVTRNEGVATLQVRDNGIGMSESLLSRVFEPFVQGERTLARSEGGLGIGLTLVKSIVEMHGGAVNAASDGIGQGSTITVTLPRHVRLPSP